MLRWLTAGESHGPELVGILEGFPAGVPVLIEDVRNDLARRRLGYGRGARMQFEEDEVSFSGGVRHGLTQGGPVSLRVRNTEWPKWETVMSASPVAPSELDTARGAPLTRPRPGHADLAGMQKFGFEDSRPVLERASARETAARVALGAVARRFLSELGVNVFSHTVEIGSVSVPDDLPLPGPGDIAKIDEDLLRCADSSTSKKMIAEVDKAHKDGDTLGGVVEILAVGLPPGLGSYTHWDRRLDSKIAGALMGIHAIKGVELGDGFRTARRSGMSTGGPLRARITMKPISTVPKALRTIDAVSGDHAVAHHQRSDVCAVPAAGVVAEAMLMLVVADSILEKFGADSLVEIKRSLEAFLDQIPENIAPALGDEK